MLDSAWVIKNFSKHEDNKLKTIVIAVHGFSSSRNSFVFAKISPALKYNNIMSSAALRGNKQESVYCATKWAERGYTESLKAYYNGTKIQIYGVYPGGINTNFYKNSRDYVSKEKQATFMPAKDLAEVIYENVFSNKKLLVEDLIINRIK